MDSRALLFFQLLISLIVLLFCISRIALGDDSPWAEMTATIIIGVWLPAPRWLLEINFSSLSFTRAPLTPTQHKHTAHSASVKRQAKQTRKQCALDRQAQDKKLLEPESEPLEELESEPWRTTTASTCGCIGRYELFSSG